MDFATRLYTTTQTFPDVERFGLTSQMRRAAVFISSSTAEGSGRTSDKDFARFVEIAYGSLMEVVSQATIALEQSFLDPNAHDDLYTRNGLAVCICICISLLFFRLIDPNGLVPLVSESIELRPACHADGRSLPAAFGGGEGAEKGGSSHAF